MQLLIAAFACFGAMSCSDDDKGTVTFEPFDPNVPMKVESFFPDSGGVATPMLIYGSNFGSDTTGLSVYFIDSLGGRHKGGLVNSNGKIIYAYVPKGLTHKRTLDVQVERIIPEKPKEPFVAKSEVNFLYRTETAVTTLIGQASPDHSAPTKPGSNFNNTTLSCPSFIAVDDEENMIIVERGFMGGRWSIPGNTDCKNSKGDLVAANILRANVKRNEIGFLLEGKSRATNLILNAPAFYDEAGNEAVYVPYDENMKYYSLVKGLSYQPRLLEVIKTEDTKGVDAGNWKHSFVVNKITKDLYTVYVKGQLLRIDPKTRKGEILLKKIGDHGEGTESYLAFSPIKPNRLFVSQSKVHQIWYVDIDELADKDKDSYQGELYAGRKPFSASAGFEDGAVSNAKFKFPSQICFNSRGVLYIADTGNHCIRTIDTTVDQEKATVRTVIGIPGNRGYKDGGPDIAKFSSPRGVAVSPDGETIYVADTGNKVIRKLSIE